MALIRKDFLFTYDCLATFYSVRHLHTLSDGFITQSFDLNNTQCARSMTCGGYLLYPPSFMSENGDAKRYIDTLVPFFFNLSIDNGGIKFM